MADIALLTNPTAGKGRGARAAAVALPRLRAAGYDVRELAGATPTESLAMARRCVADGVGTLVVVGGDGMVHIGVQAVAGTRTRLGIVPAGTGNDVARALGLPRKDPAAAADVVTSGREDLIDLARAGSSPSQGGTYFTTVLSTGFDAIVNERANRMSWPKGQMRYNLATLAELRVLRPISYVIDIDGEELRTDATLVAVGNGPSFGGGLRITEGADLRDGMLDVVIIEPLSKVELLRTYPKLFRGTHTSHAGYSHRLARRVTVTAAGIVAYADGERIGPLPLTVEAVPGALRVLVP
jgi:diacylglycerol kinase (ATP)